MRGAAVGDDDPSSPQIISGAILEEVHRSLPPHSLTWAAAVQPGCAGRSFPEHWCCCLVKGRGRHGRGHPTTCWRRRRTPPASLGKVWERGRVGRGSNTGCSMGRSMVCSMGIMRCHVGSRGRVTPQKGKHHPPSGHPTPLPPSPPARPHTHTPCRSTSLLPPSHACSPVRPAAPPPRMRYLHLCWVT